MRILMVAEGEHELHGALEQLVRRLLPPAAISHVEKLRISDPAIGHVSGPGPKLVRRILFCMRKAVQLQCAALILVIDEDNDRQRRRQINEAQDSTHFPVRRAIGIAIRTFDAWMLADETALSQTLDSSILCQPSPEDIPSPKELFVQLKTNAHSTLSLAEAYADIAARARLEILADRCPNGFAPFALRIKSLAD